VNSSRRSGALPVLRLGLFATALGVAVIGLDFSRGGSVVLASPSVIALVMLTGRRQSVRGGAVLARSIGFTNAAVAVMLCFRLVRAWHVSPHALLFLGSFAVVQALLGGVSWLLIRRPSDAGVNHRVIATGLAVGHVAQAVSVVGLWFLLDLSRVSDHGLNGREHEAITRLRTMAASETAFQSANGGAYGTPECLMRPSVAGCLPAQYPAHALTFLDATYSESARHGYVFTFVPGEPSGRGLKGFAYTAVPEAPGHSGVRAFCTDASGAIRQTIDGKLPPIVDARCPDSLRVLG
jgi:hypothetical protein